MHTILYDQNAPKKATNLSINSDLIRLARENNINISQALEHHLAEMLREKQIQKWRQENQDAIQSYNTRIETKGAFSDGLRRF